MKIGQRVLKTGCAAACGLGSVGLWVAWALTGSKQHHVLAMAAATGAGCLILTKQAIMGPDDGAKKD